MLKGLENNRPLNLNPIGSAIASTREDSNKTLDDAFHIDYGVIRKVNPSTNQVKVLLYTGKIKEMIGASSANQDGVWLSVVQPLTIIHHLFGALRKDLIVRIYWTGKGDRPSTNSMVEVVSDENIEDFISAKLEPRANELTTGPYRLFLGGVSGNE